MEEEGSKERKERTRVKKVGSRRSGRMKKIYQHEVNVRLNSNKKKGLKGRK